jgi:hypothetical protein
MEDRQTNDRVEGEGEPRITDEEFSPVGSMVLLLGYIVIFATLWGLVYYTELLARR